MYLFWPCCGVLADEPPVGEAGSWAAWRSVTAPKIAGSLNVLKAFCEVSGGGVSGGVSDRVDKVITGVKLGVSDTSLAESATVSATALVMSSSIYACLGHPRLAGYAAGNAFQYGLCAAIHSGNSSSSGSGGGGWATTASAMDERDETTHSGTADAGLTATRSTQKVVSSRPSFGGCPNHAVAIQWGTWASEGMAARLGAPFEALWKRQGMGFVQPAEGMAVVGSLLSALIDQGPASAVSTAVSTPPTSGVSPGVFPDADWVRYAAIVQSQGRRVPAALCELVAEATTAAETVASDHHGVAAAAAAWAAATSADAMVAASQPSSLGYAAVVAAVRSAVTEAASSTGIGADFADDQPLMSAGLASSGAVAAHAALEAGLGLTLPSTLVFDYPTVLDIAVRGGECE
jgi:hypothetical protein